MKPAIFLQLLDVPTLSIDELLPSRLWYALALLAKSLLVILRSRLQTCAGIDVG